MTVEKAYALSIESRSGQLEELRAWVLSIQKEIGLKAFPDEALLAVTLSLIEAVNNAIFHAHASLPNAQIEVRLACSDKAIWLEVSDQGKGFTLQKDFKLPKPQSDHGRGLFLMHEMMDEVSNSFDGKKHTLRMVYKL